MRKSFPKKPTVSSGQIPKKTLFWPFFCFHSFPEDRKVSAPQFFYVENFRKNIFCFYFGWKLDDVQKLFKNFSGIFAFRVLKSPKNAKLWKKEEKNAWILSKLVESIWAPHFFTWKILFKTFYVFTSRQNSLSCRSCARISGQIWRFVLYLGPLGSFRPKKGQKWPKLVKKINLTYLYPKWPQNHADSEYMPQNWKKPIFGAKNGQKWPILAC